MKTLLKLNASIFGENGASSRLTNAFVARWVAAHPGAHVIERDLATDPLPHLTADVFAGFNAQPAERSAAQQAAVDTSDALIDELERADVIVLGLPMYNFGVPSTLKAYFDHVARVGVTFRYTEKGPVGLLGGKQAYVFAARGGLYAGTPRDTQTPYVRVFLNFLGIEDVRFTYAEGLNIGPAVKEASLAKAHAEIDRLALPEQAVAL